MNEYCNHTRICNRYSSNTSSLLLVGINTMRSEQDLVATRRSIVSQLKDYEKYPINSWARRKKICQMQTIEYVLYHYRELDELV